MTLYICLDDRNGLKFNKRRQSRDAAVLEDIRSQFSGKLLIEPFSEKLIQAAEIPYVLPPETAEDYFAEDVPSEDILAQTEKLIIYRWNRRYQADLFFDIELKGWIIESASDFPGTSHEKITREVYIRE